MFRIGLLILAAILGYVGFVFYDRHELNVAISSALRGASTRFTVQAQYATNSPPGQTIAERLSSIQLDVAEIEKSRIAVQQRSTKKTRGRVSAADNQLKNVQSVLRSLAAKTRGEIALNIALKQHRGAMSALLDAVLTPLFDSANRGAESAVDSVRAADADYQIAYSQVSISLNDLFVSNEEIAKSFSKDDSIAPESIKALAAEALKERIEVNYGE